MTKWYVGMGPAYGITTFEFENGVEAAIDFLKERGAEDIHVYTDYGNIEIEFEANEDTQLETIGKVFELYKSFQPGDDE